MADKFVIQETQATDARERSGLALLDSDFQRRSCKSLSVTAFVYAAAYFLVWLYYWGLDLMRADAFCWPDLAHSLYALVSIFIAIFTGFWARRENLSGSAVGTICEIFLVAGAFGIAVNHWGWETHALEMHEVGVPWIGVWILFLANLLTFSPNRILRSSLIAAATSPLVMLVSAVAHGLPPGAENPTKLVLYSILRDVIPVLICLGIAYVGASRVFSLSCDVSEAKRMGSYELVEKLGSGGMGEVWKARHRMLARPAAIKLIRVSSFSDGRDDSDARRALRRFEREAQATAALTSPHTVDLYDFGVTDDGTFYYVMELLHGLDLKSLVERSGPVPAERAIRFLRQACNSLADAHECGLVHRDVKPANLFICRRGLEYDFVKVLDFGLVKEAALEDPEARTQLTLEGAASGTPGFMAPEIASGDHPVDQRADIYGLGCVAYWLLCGRLVFEGRTPMAILLQHLKDEPPPPSSRTEHSIPPALERIVLDCLAKDPRVRPQSAPELAERLARVERDVGTWTQEDAERWWRIQMPDLAATTRVGAHEGASAGSSRP